MAILFSFITGLIFGLGLIISGMANPAKVLGFLDLAGMWDPSLTFVMLGAIAIGSIAFYFVRQRKFSLLGLPLHLPQNHHVDKRLITGSALFGIGWGLAGICPGPALVLLGAGLSKGAIFVAAMFLGMTLYQQIQKIHLPR